MWKYLRKYWPFALLAVLAMSGEVLMDLSQPGLMRQIIDYGVLRGAMGVVWRSGGLMVGMVLAGCACGSMNNLCVHLFSQNVGNDMRKECFRRALALSAPQMERIGAGAVVTRVTNDITQVQNMLAQFIRGLVRTSLLTFGSIFFMFRLNPLFGWIMLGTVPFLAAAVTFGFSHASPLFGKLQATLDDLNALMQEDLGGIRLVKACVREGYERARFGKANARLLGYQLAVMTVFAFLHPTVNLLMNTGIVLLLAVGSGEVAAGRATPGAILAALSYSTQLLHGVMMMAFLFQFIARGLASWRRVRELLASTPELADGAYEGAAGQGGRIEFRKVVFCHPGESQPVLNGVDLVVEPGETVALMGATGCGKTTLAMLVPRFYDAAQGSVLVDGVDVRDYRLEALRRRIALVLQRSELFHRSIAGNIALGAPGADEAAIREAARIAQAAEFIDARPGGYDALVSERGMALSGGQRQRVAIARAVAKSAGILIFDDASSALDLKTEAHLHAALKEAFPGQTRLVIAQRIATVRQADRIVLLEHGVIAASGTHAELLRGCAAYRDIYDSQMEEAEHG